MLARRAKPLIYALLLSFLFHLAVLFGPTITLPDWTPAPPLTVDIQPRAPKPLPPVAAPRPPPRPKPRRPASPPATMPEAPPAPSPEPTPLPVAETPPAPAPEPPPEPLAPEPPPITTRQAFPANIEIVYSVHRGDHGIKLGNTTHQWQVRGTQYVLTSTTEASGLFSLFFSGRYIMTSRGDITPDGLQPSTFWIQRGQSEDRTEFAEFDWQARTLDYGKGAERHSVGIGKGAQDQLSVFYQLALTAPHGDRVQFALTTGRKFNHYTYQVVGTESLDSALGPLQVEHLSRVTTPPDKGDSADIWLAIDYHYLPVRFRLGTRDGEVLDHWIAELRVDGKRVQAKPEQGQ